MAAYNPHHGFRERFAYRLHSTQNRAAARAFYEGLLTLTVEDENPFALVFRIGQGVMLRVVSVKQVQPVPYTVFGWEVEDIVAAVHALTDKSIALERYGGGFIQQDELGIWNAPDGSRIAWFKDPDGNTLSISQHTA